MFELLLESNADISVQDRYGNNVLHIAATTNDIIALEIIIRTERAKAEIGNAKLKRVLSAENKKNKKPTELATNQEAMEVLNIIIIINNL